MKNNTYIKKLLRLYQTKIKVVMDMSLTIVLLIMSSFIAFSQADAPDDLTISNEMPDTIATKEDTAIISSNYDTIADKMPIDTEIVETANKVFTIYEYENGMVIDRLDLRTGEIKRVLDMKGNECEPVTQKTKFRGHWSGFEVGLNNYMYNGFTFKSPAEYDYMDLKTISSWNINLNFAQLSIPFGKNVGLVTGLGYEVNLYRFKHDNSIQRNETSGIIEERVLEGLYDVRKSKFNTKHLTLPLLLEAQFPKAGCKEMFYMSCGIIWGYNTGSAIKIKHEVNGNKQKIIERNRDLNINKWRTGITFRMGSRDKDNNSSGFYITYYFKPLFEENMGPELYPVQLGFRIDL